MSQRTYDRDVALKFYARYIAFSSDDPNRGNYLRILHDLAPVRKGKSSTIKGLVDSIFDNAGLDDSERTFVGVRYGLFNGCDISDFKLDERTRAAVEKLDSWAMKQRRRAVA